MLINSSNLTRFMDEENSLEQAGDAMNNDQPSVKGESTLLPDVAFNCSCFF